MGEISHLFPTPAGVMCMKFVVIVPADATSYRITDKTLEALKTAGIHPEVLSKLDPIKNKDFTRVDLDAELSRILNPELCKLVNAQSNKNLTPDDLHQIQNSVVSQAADSTATLAKVRPALRRDLREEDDRGGPEVLRRVENAGQPEPFAQGTAHHQRHQEVRGDGTHGTEANRRQVVMRDEG